MYILIDNHKLVVLKVTSTLQQAEYWADILCPMSDFRIQGKERKEWSAYTAKELFSLYNNTFKKAPRPCDYPEMIKQLSEAVNELKADQTTIEDLHKKLNRSPVSPKESFDRLGKPKERDIGRINPGTRASTAEISQGASTPWAKPTPSPTTPPASGARPKAGTTTGKVWAIADEIAAKFPDIPEKNLRTKIIVACEDAQINSATAGVQYSKWKKVHKA